MVPGKPLWSVDIRGGQRGSLVENGAQSALGRRTIKRRVPEGECARCFQKQHVAMTKCCHRPCAPSGRSMTPASLPTSQHYLRYPGDLPDSQPVSPPQGVDPT